MTTAPLILVVDDEPGIQRLIKLELSPQGFQVETAGNAMQGLAAAEQLHPALVVVDVAMPGVSGLELLRQLREKNNVPVILLLAGDRDDAKVRGLESGADDYIGKPFNPEELSARVRAVLRRGFRMMTPAQSVVRSDSIEIDLMRRSVKKEGSIVSLSRSEWMVLQHLAANAGKVLLSSELLSKVWGPEFTDNHRVLQAQIYRLRRKLGASLIMTLPGIGYILEPRETSPGIGIPSLLMQAIVIPGDRTAEDQLIRSVAYPWFEIIDLIAKDPDFVFKLTWRQWEEIIAGAYEQQGFRVILTPGSGDGGRDVIAESRELGSIRFVDQVKAYKPGNLVTADDVRAMLGVLTRDSNVSKGIVTTTSEFAPGVAEEFRAFMPYRIELKARRQLLEWLSSVRSKRR